MKRYLWIPAIAAAMVVVMLTPARAAKNVDFDALTIADINKAFDSGALTGRGRRCTR